MNITKRLDDLEERLNLTGLESPVEQYIRQQECLKFYYTQPRPTQTEMVKFSKDHGKTDAAYKDNFQTFVRLVAQHDDPNFFEKRKAELTRRWT